MASLKSIYNTATRRLQTLLFGAPAKAEWEKNPPARPAQTSPVDGGPYPLGTEGASDVPAPEAAPAPVEASEARRPVHIVFCQDASTVQKNGATAIEALASRGYPVTLKGVEGDAELMTYLKTLEKKKAPPPDAIFMDVGGVGERTALKVIKWFDKNHPDKPLPAINFMSLDNNMGINEAGALRNSDARVEASFVDAQEVAWTARYLAEGLTPRTPASATFRQVLNKLVGLAIPETHDDSYYKDALKNMRKVTTDRVIVSYQRGQIGPEEVIERMRPYATGLANALRNGLYGQNAEALEELSTDAQFYASAGFPVKGPIVLSPEAVDNMYYNSREKPVLVMQAYDPAVVPLLSSGRLGGLVVTSPYMASHLKLLCETNMVSGLFGMVPPGKSLRTEFNEEAKPDAAPYFEKAPVIAGHRLESGHEVLIGLRGNGLCAAPPDALRTQAIDIYNIERDEKLSTDLRNLRAIEKCFAKFFEQQGLPPHGVKSNIESSRWDLLEFVGNIGLVRTEQMVAGNERQLAALKRGVLGQDARGFNDLIADLRYDYGAIFNKLQQGDAVKIRLFDFVYPEILTKDEQKKFEELYGTKDIHGGEAFRRFPQLYEGQVREIFETLSEYKNDLGTKLEIMMPALRTEEEVLAVKSLIDKTAKQMGVGPERYSFGAMVETLDACRNIKDIAKHCDFISFGTNDLTQEYTGMARNDLKAHAVFAGKNGYNPFQQLSPEVFGIMKDVVEQGRAVNPQLRIDVCGAQAADPGTAQKLYAAGIDNVSVAPNLGNLYAMPILASYLAYDALKAANPALQPSQPQQSTRLTA